MVLLYLLYQKSANTMFLIAVQINLATINE